MIFTPRCSFCHKDLYIDHKVSSYAEEVSGCRVTMLACEDCAKQMSEEADFRKEEKVVNKKEKE